MRHALGRVLFLCGALGVTACTGSEPVTFGLVTGRDATPFSGEVITIAVERDGVILDERAFPMDSPTFALPSLPFGTGLRIRVQVLTGGTVFARGHSFPFDAEAGQPVTPTPHVFVGELGNFARTTTGGPDGKIVGLIAADDGARFVTDAGSVWAYRAHGALDGSGEALLEIIARAPSDRLDGSWVGVGRWGWIAVGGSNAGLSLVRADGEVLDERATGLEEHGTGAAVVGFEDGALVIGGSSTGAATTAVTWLSALPDADRIEIRTAPALPFPVADARAIAVRVREVGRESGRRVLVLGGKTSGGAPSDTALLVDPDGVRPPVSAPLALEGLEDAGLSDLGEGLVLVVGGGRTGAALDRLDVLSLRADSTVPIDLLPRPTPLARGVLGPAVIPFAPGRALIAGGRSSSGAPVDHAHVFGVELGALPGEADATAPLPAPAGSPRGIALDDGSLLVVDEGTLALYSPHDP